MEQGLALRAGSVGRWVETWMSPQLDWAMLEPIFNRSLASSDQPRSLLVEILRFRGRRVRLVVLVSADG